MGMITMPRLLEERTESRNRPTTSPNLSPRAHQASEVFERVRTTLVDLLHLRACRKEKGLGNRPMMRLERDGQVLLAVGFGASIDGASWTRDRAARRPARQDSGRFVLTPTQGSEVPLQPRVVAVRTGRPGRASLAPRLHRRVAGGVGADGRLTSW